MLRGAKPVAAYLGRVIKLPENDIAPKMLTCAPRMVVIDTKGPATSVIYCNEKEISFSGREV